MENIMDNRILLLKQCEKKLFAVKKCYLKSNNESGYLKYRLLRPILKIKYYFFRKLNDPCPWLSPTSVRFLKRYLTKEMVGFEYGSGLSTLFISPKVKHLTSIEHNSDWYKFVSTKIKERRINTIDYRLISQEKGDMNEHDKELKDEYNFLSRKDYVTYYDACSHIPDESLDFILVDGRARPECIYKSLSKLKKNAIIILDNSERDRYRIVFKMLDKFQSYTTTNGLTNTTFWFKNEV